MVLISDRERFLKYTQKLIIISGSIDLNSSPDENAPENSISEKTSVVSSQNLQRSKGHFRCLHVSSHHRRRHCHLPFSVVTQLYVEANTRLFKFDITQIKLLTKYYEMERCGCSWSFGCQQWWCPWQSFRAPQVTSLEWPKVDANLFRTNGKRQSPSVLSLPFLFPKDSNVCFHTIF